MDRHYDFITFISKYLHFKNSIVAIFADIIRVETIFIKTLKTQKKLEQLEIMYQNPIHICIS